MTTGLTPRAKLKTDLPPLRDEYVCQKCGQPCETIMEIEREPFEFWGQRGIHEFQYHVSVCCGDDVDPIH